MKDKNKNIIIVFACIATALVCIVLTFWGNWKNDGILTTDAFMAVLATFIGICATLIVGVQIINHLELRKIQKTIKDIEEERASLKADKDAFAEEMFEARKGIGNALWIQALLAKESNNNVLEFLSIVISIVIANWRSTDSSALISRYKRLEELSKAVIPVVDKSSLQFLYKSLLAFNLQSDIDQYDDIMALHYQLISALKKRIEKLSTDSLNQ